MLARIKVLVAKVPTICAALDCQGGDSGQIIARGGGGGEIFKRVLLAFQEQKTCLQVSSLLVFKFSALRKAGKTTRGMGLAGRARRVKAGCDLTASMPLRSFGEAFYHRCSFARKMRRCRCRWCYLYLLILLSARYDFGGFGDV